MMSKTAVLINWKEMCAGINVAAGYLASGSVAAGEPRAALACGVVRYYNQEMLPEVAIKHSNVFL